jgi:hypothetical protein
MEGNSTNQGVSRVAHELQVIEEHLSGHLAAMRKIKDRLTRARRNIAKGKAVSELTRLVADFRAMSLPAAPPDPQQLAAGLAPHVRSLAEAYGNSLRRELQRQCEEANVPLRQLADGFGVGPFALTIDVARESASLQYAKVLVVNDLPLNAVGIVKAVQELADPLLQVPDPALLANRFEEAIRVALVRQKKSLARGAMRVGLPAIFREMAFICSKSGAPPANDYPLPRFIVELKTLVQSDQNIQGDRRFRLETAVLENSKDPRKSVFVPNDVSVGYGEGTYFQAIVLAAPA